MKVGAERSRDRRTIVFVAPRYHTNQVGTVRTFLDRGHRVAFHCLLVGPTEDHALLAPTVFEEGRLSRLLGRVMSEGGANKPRAFPAIMAYFRLLRRTKPDVMIIRDPSRLFSLLAAVCGRFLGARLLFYNQTPLRRHDSMVRRLVTRFFLLIFDAAWITTVSGDESDPKPQARSYFLPFVVEGERKAERRSQRVEILVVGKYQPRKNLHLMVDAIHALAKDYDIHAVVVGECVTPEQAAVRDELRRQIASLGLSREIELLQNIPFREMGSFYTAADIFVLPASDEPASVAVLEAIAHGTPAVCSTTCGTRFYIRAGYNGMIFESGSRQDLVRVLDACLRDPNRLSQMSDNCFDFAMNELSPEAYFSRFEAMMADRWPKEAGRVRTGV